MEPDTHYRYHPLAEGSVSMNINLILVERVTDDRGQLALSNDPTMVNA